MMGYFVFTLSEIVVCLLIRFVVAKVTKCGELPKPTEDDLKSGEVLVKILGKMDADDAFRQH